MPNTPAALDFEWTEEASQVLDLARRYAADLRAACRETEAGGTSERLRRVCDDLGLSKLHWPEARGGMGLGLGLKLAVLELLGQADAPAALALDREAWVGTALLPWASDVSPRASFHIDADLSLRFEDGRLRGAISYLPAAAPATIPAPATIIDQLWLLRGATLLRLDGGFTLEPVEVGALHALGASRAVIDAAPAWSRELTSDEAWALAAAWRLPLAAVLTGLARAAYEYARDYALQRVAFGRKVAHHQAVAFLFADMAIAVETAALRLQEAGASGNAESADLAFLQAAEGALFVSNQALQLVGGAGYMRDHLVEKFMREARALTLLAGGVDAALEAVGATS